MSLNIKFIGKVLDCEYESQVTFLIHDRAVRITLLFSQMYIKWAFNIWYKLTYTCHIGKF